MGYAAAIVIALMVIHLITIGWIHGTRGDTIGAQTDIGSALKRLARERPVAYRIYRASLLLILLEFGVYMVVGSIMRTTS
jgi:hypothetical protein